MLLCHCELSQARDANSRDLILLFSPRGQRRGRSKSVLLRWCDTWWLHRNPPRAKTSARKVRTSSSARANCRSVADDIWLHVLLEHQVHDFQGTLSNASGVRANGSKGTAVHRPQTRAISTPNDAQLGQPAVALARQQRSSDHGLREQQRFHGNIDPPPPPPLMCYLLQLGASSEAMFQTRRIYILSFAPCQKAKRRYVRNNRAKQPASTEFPTFSRQQRNKKGGTG